jgi:DNA polymerase III subunit delta
VTPPVLLLSGDDFLLDEALDSLRADIGADPLSETAFDAADEVSDILTALRTPSLLGGTRVVVVHQAQEIRKAAAEPLVTYVESPEPSSVLVLTATGRTNFDAAVKKAGGLVQLEAPKGRRLVSWLRTQARKRGLKLDDKAAWALTDTVGTELRGLDGALEQISTQLGPGARVEPAHVRKAFPRLADGRIYTFTDAVGDRNLAPSMSALRRLLDQGEEPLVLFGALTSQIRRMLRAKSASDGGPPAVGDALGLPRWRAERLYRQTRGYKEEDLLAAMAILADTDIEMKGGDLTPEAALERAVIRIVAGPAAATGA